MLLPDLSIRRPVLAWVGTLVILILGVVGYTRLPVRELPDIDFPIVTVSVLWRGASPDVVETEVIDTLEEEINTLEGVKNITSQSREQGGVVTIEFELERNIDVALQDVRDAVSRIRNRLPRDIEEPVVRKLDLDAQAIMWVGVNSDWMNPVQLSDFADRVLKERLQTLPGVGSILIGGEQRFAVRIDIDAAKLAARRLTVRDVANALRRENVELPSGRIESGLREFVVRTQGRFPTPESFNELVVAHRDGTPIRIKDVGEARYGVENERVLARFMGKPSVGLGILKQSKANTLDVADRVKAELEKIRKDLPPGVNMAVAFDISTFIKQSVDATRDALWLAGLLVVLVIFFFLRNLRSSFIPAVVIPVSVIGTFAVMFALGFTINVITLLALILAVGLLVDDAIVMLENIYRHMEKEHEDRIEAARTGAKEIGFAVVATSIALGAVFVPVAFITGMIGKFFYEFGLTVAAAVFISTFVALTLTPMLCSRVLRVKKRHNAIYNKLEAGFNWFGDTYARILGASLRHRWLVVVIAAVSFAVSLYIGKGLSREFAPQQDQGSIIVVARAPEGATLEQSNQALKQLESIIAATPEVRTYFAAIGLGMGGVGQPNHAIMFIALKNRDQRQRGQFEIMNDLRRKISQIPGMLIFLQERSPFGGGQNTKPVQYVIQHPDTKTLADSSEALVRRLRQTPGFVDVDSDLQINKPELEIKIDRALAADLGISAADVAETLQIMLGGQEVTEYKERGKQYDVIVQLRGSDREKPRDLENIYLRANGRDLVPITNLVSFDEKVGPSQINHYNRRRSVIVSSNLDNMPLGDALTTVDGITKEILPTEATTDMAGAARDLGESFKALGFTFVLAIILIYLVLAAQFESWVHPFTIMTGLPLALFGAVGALWLVGQTLNIYSFIGLIMLVGLVSKNGILLIDYINQQRNKGVPRFDAVVAAGRVRLRPILMTALTTVIGVVPIALGYGAGGEARKPLGTVVVGGMLVSTFLTLVVIPVIYTLLDDIIPNVRRHGHKSEEATPSSAAPESL